ncbi:replication protein [Pseudomonas sp. PS1]|uniref:Replication protein n=1 Tax=Stutzerimonas marianensis TaxID=2929513 RepID=A0A9X1W3I7_9GAMM|nr:replication protein [Pseudomonas marianensis]MCJ0972707.1 replication protein [Pseudomonas marianensis]
MDNVIQIGNTQRGFTRMDNSIMESLAAVDLPAREFRVLMAVARQTIGYQVETKRLSADDLGKLTNMRRDVVSKAISHLLERRIMFRVGGSRGELGISPVSEWTFYDQKQNSLNETKSSHSAQIVSLRQDASETKTATCFLYTKKTTLPSEEIVTPPVKGKSEAKAKSRKPSSAGFGLTHMLADNPHAIPDQLLQDWIALRKQKRAALSATVWTALNAELHKCVAAGISAETAMTEALVAGWQGFKVDWIIKRLTNDGRMPAGKPAAPDFHSGDTSWAEDLGDL